MKEFWNKFVKDETADSRFVFAALIAAAVLFAVLSGCTKQTWNRNFGGKMRIDLPPGQELMEATWKEDSLFYLTRPMTSNYVPVTKTFAESSPYGLLESTVEFVERR